MTAYRTPLRTALLALGLACACVLPSFGATVLTPGTTAEDVRTLADPTDLWVLATELPRINGFELKPEGACKGELCIPVTGDQDPILYQQDGSTWFSLTAFARRTGQVVAVDRDRAVWSFSEVPATRASGLLRAKAPDFTLPDRAGKPVRLSEFRGRKVLLLSWASW